ncbi:hypothetical protein EDM55_03915 [Brevibacillus centrosporus]|nr:hypothetical protein EDM55_03915 [Brevibacillus centrosporus]
MERVVCRQTAGKRYGPLDAAASLGPASVLGSSVSRVGRCFSLR